jgi:HIV Tat-specific factor 1
LRSTTTPEHAFTLEEDPEAYYDIKDDMTEEAEKHGEFTTITLFDMEVDGIITIRLCKFEQASISNRVI